MAFNLKGDRMKILVYILLWSVIFVIAVAIKVYLGEFLDGIEIAKAAKSLVKAIPTGVCVGIGVALQSKLKVYFEKKHS